ncbi:sensor histidine kinase [uncultured Kordia sp.]|uniref:tetratricopeptide repeat-containing sensor histidine kinase n=1 Tax=uncultured Kordia sp. TaxID=507699 RepID=UPI002607BD6B|nr:sensor histidine kinase [uncultured Kordia sp.]
MKLFQQLTYKILIIICLMYCGVTLSYAQANQQVIDSISNVCKTMENDSVRIQYLHRVFFKYAYSKPEISRKLSEIALQKSKIIQNTFLTTRSLLRKGVYYDIVGKKDSSLILYDKAFEIAKKQNDKDAMASVFNNKGLIYWGKEKYKEAMDYYLSSYKIFEELGLKKGQANSLNNIGLLLSRLDRHQESNAYHKRSLAIRKEIDDTYGIGASYTNMVMNFSSLKHLDSCIYYGQKSVVTKTKINDVKGLATSYNSLGKTYQQLKQRDSAIYYLQKADEIYARFNARKHRAKNIQLLGIAHYDEGNYKAAIDAYTIALDNLNDSQIMIKSDAVRRMANAYRELGNHKNASEYYQETITLLDTIQKEKEKIATTEIFEKYQSSEKEKEILLQRAQIAERNSKIVNKNITIYGMLAGILVLLVIGYLLYNQQKLKNRQLQKEHELKDALIKVETQNKLHEQRLKISRDLHDNIGSQLTFIISSIDNLKYGLKETNPEFTERLSNINFFTRNTINQLRDTIWAMNMERISFEDLKTRMINHIGQAKILTGASIEFANQVSETTTFSSLVGINIFRIMQEAINNAIKHSKSESITINFIETNDQYTLHVEDNGVGFDNTPETEGNGLENMQLRAEEIYGKFHIVAASNTGTKITLTLDKAVADNI